MSSSEKPIVDKRIIDCLTADYGLEVTCLSHLALGADIDASVYRAETKEQAFFVKLRRGVKQDVSTSVIEFLYDCGIREIIVPLKTTHGHTSQIDGFTLIVAPFVEGQNGFCQDLSNDQWVRLGQVLKKIHDIDVPDYIQALIRKETYTSKWRAAVQKLLVQIELDPPKDEIALKLVAFIKKHKAKIERLIVEAEQLSHKLDRSAKLVLCHSDIHGGNVLIDKKGDFYIVDWDDPIMAPKERDLMFIGGGVANVWNKPHEEKAFYEGYPTATDPADFAAERQRKILKTHPSIDLDLLSYFRHERILEDIALIAQQIFLATVSQEDKLISYQHFVDQFEPNGVVEIAFKTTVLA